MRDGESDPTNNAPTAPSGGDDGWHVEVLAPIRPALLVTLISELPDNLGIEVSITELGTLLLNAAAWERFCDKLLALDGLSIRHGYDIRTKPIKFLITE